MSHSLTLKCLAVKKFHSYLSVILSSTLPVNLSKLLFPVVKLDS